MSKFRVQGQLQEIWDCDCPDCPYGGTHRGELALVNSVFDGDSSDVTEVALADTVRAKMWDDALWIGEPEIEEVDA